MIIKVCICIPTYNNQTTIADVTEGCLRDTKNPIWIIDDGSEYELKKLIFSSSFPNISEALKSNRLRIITHSSNQGKGRAIQTAIQEAVKAGFTHLITIDGDGQHPTEELPKFLTAIKEAPWDLIIGNRNFVSNKEHIPEISKFGRKFSNFWVKYETGLAINDSQSGFRGYPLFHIQNTNFFTKKYDFEIEILIRLLWKGISIKEIDISVFYPPAEKRISHFNKFTDNARISLLNVILVAISLFRSGLSPKQMAKGVGLGVFIGCTPFFGLHTFIVTILALLFRLNVVVSWIGTQISIPPIAPLLIFSSLLIGHKLTGSQLMVGLDEISFKLAYNEFGLYLLGSLVTGSILGSTFGGLVYLIFKCKQRQQKIQNWSGKSRGGRFGNWFIKRVVRRLGLGPAHFCLFFITPYFYFFAPKATRASKEYWEIVSPGLNFWQLRFKVLTHYYRFGTLLIDRLFQTFNEELIFNSVSTGEENITTALKNNRGLILVGAHFGGWDIASYYLKQFDLSSTFQIVKYRYNDKSFKNINSDNETKVEEIITNSNQLSIINIKTSIANGCPVAFMADRPTNNSYELIPFFGKLIPFDTTPFRISATLQAPLCYFFAAKGKNKDYIFVSSPIKNYTYQKGINSQLQVKEWLTEFASALENIIREHPSQWLNFYPAWSSRPDVEIECKDKWKSKNNLVEELDIPLGS